MSEVEETNEKKKCDCIECNFENCPVMKIDDIYTDVGERISKTLEHESDRGSILIGAAIIHDYLCQVLKAYFRDDNSIVRNAVESLFEPYRPLSSFSACIEFCYVLGILSRKVRNELDLLRKLRNEFAHCSMPMDFLDGKSMQRIQEFLGIPSSIGGVDICSEKKRLAYRAAILMKISKLCGRFEVIRKFILAEAVTRISLRDAVISEEND